MQLLSSLRTVTINAIAWSCVSLVMALFRCFTLLILNRFPSTVLPDVEVFTALWVLTQAPYAWRWSNARVASKASFSIDVETAEGKQPLKHSAPRRDEKEEPAATATAASTPNQQAPFSCETFALSKHLTLYLSATSTAEPATPTPEGKDQTPRTTNNTTPQTQVPGHGPIRGPLFLSPSEMSTPENHHHGMPPLGTGTNTAGLRPRRVLLWLNLSTAAQRRGVSLSALLTIARAADMTLALLEMEPLQSAPSLDATLDHVVEAVKLVNAHFVGPNGLSSKSQLDRLFAMADIPPPLVTMGGCALTATVAMLAVARRFPALMQCNGLLLFDPFVGWTCSPQSRRVSFHDESLNSNNHSDTETAGNGSFSHAWSNPTSPATPARMPTKGAVKTTSATSLRRRKSISPTDNYASPEPPTRPSPRRGGEAPRSLLEQMSDGVHEVASAVRARLRKDFLTKALKVWFPAAQWAATGCAVPLFVVVDTSSIWADDQLEFVHRWRQSGDDIEHHSWTPDGAWQQSPLVELDWEQLRTLAYARRRQQTVSPSFTYSYAGPPPLSELSPLTSPAQAVCNGTLPPTNARTGQDQLRAALVEATSWLLAFRTSNNATPAHSIDTPGFFKYSSAVTAGLLRPVALNAGDPFMGLPPMIRSLKRLNSRESVQGDPIMERNNSTGFSASGRDGTSLPSAESVSDLLSR